MPDAMLIMGATKRSSSPEMQETTGWSHEELAARILRGDQTAEGELFRRFSRPLRSMLVARSGDPFLADDLMQDTFGVLLTRLRDKPLSDPTSLSRFVHKTALNLWIGHARKETRRKTSPDSETVEQAKDNASSQLEHIERSREDDAVRELLGELKNERDRQILLRTFVLEQEKRDICEALDLTPANFDRVIYRAKQRFREIVERNMEYTP